MFALLRQYQSLNVSCSANGVVSDNSDKLTAAGVNVGDIAEGVDTCVDNNGQVLKPVDH